VARFDQQRCGVIIENLVQQGIARSDITPQGVADALGHRAPIDQLTALIVCFIDGGWDEIVENYHGDSDRAYQWVRSGILEMLDGELYREASIEIHRWIRVTCPPEAVQVEGDAERIGVSWSLLPRHREPYFLDQYGAHGGRDVYINADVTHDEVDWFTTIWKSVDPANQDIQEISLHPTARPMILSVVDPLLPTV